MHLILPFAASLSPSCQQALPRLDDTATLPHLHQLLGRLTQHTRQAGDEYALSMPHERVLAQHLGWGDLPDGTLPWGAYDAQQNGVQTADLAWGLITPCHWLMGRETLTLIDPDELKLQEADSRTLLETLRPWFEEEGWTLLYRSPTRWYASHPTLTDLPTASIERVIGRNPDVWMPDHPQARLIKRLQSEVQMLMYQHPLNEQRQAEGRLPVNSFWLSACGRLPSATPTAPATILIHELRAPMLSNHWADWVAAWQVLDATVFKQACDALDAQQPVSLTLCGECHALTLSAAPAPTLAQRLGQHWQRLRGRPGPSVSALLSTL